MSKGHFINIDDQGWYAVGPEGIKKIRRFLARNYVLGDLGDENEQLRETLKQVLEYAGHKDKCRVRYRARICDCGWQELYRQIQSLVADDHS